MQPLFSDFDPLRMIQELSPADVEVFKESVMWKLIENDLYERLEEADKKLRIILYKEDGISTGTREMDIALKAQIKEIEFLLVEPDLILADVKTSNANNSIENEEREGDE